MLRYKKIKGVLEYTYYYLDIYDRWWWNLTAFLARVKWHFLIVTNTNIYLYIQNPIKKSYYLSLLNSTIFYY